ncbi:arsenical-resistance protein [Rhinocladiella mackenziei CBS 650.93]|uniref:Arsenical-resistance protein n=1 Tax=Rhinocladiella mackenziei CBS 650.93 TaxID=1442369 RepID=A0A0D2FLB6_9EURO|nr:arsenical-resistance protein [Rhinocladiella mackenziei CBS 650.93]KIX02767.1 arsenical-resistance protein [Rhinocladiella mackenziei CBS 650.93]
MYICAGRGQESVYAGLGLLERLLALWILLAIVVGILLGNFVVGVGPASQRGKFVDVSVPIGEQDRTTFRRASEPDPASSYWPVSDDVSYLVQDKVLIWTGLAGGDEEYCAILVAVNSILQMVLCAPLAVLLVNVISQGARRSASYTVVARSVGGFLGIPLGAAIATRFALRAINDKWYDQKFIKWIASWSLIGLLHTILVMFASQGKQVVYQIVSVVRVAAPLIIYFVVVFFLTLWITEQLGFGYRLAATQSFTAASNNFELAIAVAVATTVGPLIEVPVLIALVYFVRWIAPRWGWRD